MTGPTQHLQEVQADTDWLCLLLCISSLENESGPELALLQGSRQLALQPSSAETTTSEQTEKRQVSGLSVFLKK